MSTGPSLAVDIGSPADLVAEDQIKAAVAVRVQKELVVIPGFKAKKGESAALLAFSLMVLP
jgi:hypothetical protein